MKNSFKNINNLNKYSLNNHFGPAIFSKILEGPSIIFENYFRPHTVNKFKFAHNIDLKIKRVFARHISALSWV